jgi:hypothetical protein
MNLPTQQQASDRSDNHAHAQPQGIRPLGRRTSQRDLVIRSLILCPEPADRSSEA